MRTFHFISFVFFLCVFAQDVLSQEPPRRTVRQRPSEAVASSDVPSLSTRALIKNEGNTADLKNVVWLREVYRYIDLEKENNAALYYPTQPVGDRKNLFTLLFKLLTDGKITGYRYIDGREVFTDEEKVNLEDDILKRLQILYAKQGTQYVIDNSDIPSAEVTLYMIKEAYYFDQATGSYNSAVTAICPMLVRVEDDYGSPERSPFCWFPYEAIRPYLSREMVMTSNYNNALTYTIDDYFAQKMYQGDIVKTVNLMNKTLAQQVGNDPELMKLAQDSIENQLKAFNKSLWIQNNDTVPPVVVNKDGKEKKENKKTSGRGAKKEKEEKPKASKSEKSQGSPTKSVRRTR
jgi:gliding motility associated protien GldN